MLGSIISLLYIDKLGRRYILLRLIPFISIALIILSIGLGLNGFAEGSAQGIIFCGIIIFLESGKWISMIGLILYLIFFSVSLGTIPWTVNSEIYPLHLRGAGQSVSTTTNWVSNYVISQVFLLATVTTLGQVVTFSSLAFCCAFSWVFVYFLLPETKGRPIEDIVEEICPHTRKNLDQSTISEKLDSENSQK